MKHKKNTFFFQAKKKDMFLSKYLITLQKSKATSNA